MFSTLLVSDVKADMGKLIKKMRTNRNLTQEELARQLNLSRITIQHIEQGKNFTIEVYLLALQYFDEMASLSMFIKTKLDEQQSIKSIY